MPDKSDQSMLNVPLDELAARLPSTSAETIEKTEAAKCGDASAAPAKPVITFKVVREPYGWAIRRDHQMMTPAWCKALAVEEARRMVGALRRHGEPAEVWIEDAEA